MPPSKISLVSKAGFTLIELLLAALLVPLVAFAVYANFNSGIKIWQRLQQQTSVEDLNIFSQKTMKRFEGAINYAGINFEGDENSVTFPALIETEEKLGGNRAIGRIRIYYDPKERSIKALQENISQVYRGNGTVAQTLLARVDSMKISYFAENKQDKTFQWFESWVNRPSELPVAVRLEFEFADASGPQTAKKTFAIPTGG